MANEPTIIGTTGWRTLFDYSAGAGNSVRIRVSAGPASGIDGQITALRYALDVETLDTSVSPGSAVATIRCTYRTLPDGGLPLSERRSPTFAVTPLMKTMDIRGHKLFSTIPKEKSKIERYISAGDIDALKTAYAGNTTALLFAAFWADGTSAYEEAAFQLTITRYYTSAPTISADYAAINKVYAWADIKTDGKGMPSYVEEPKYKPETGDAVGFEWRLVSVAPVIERHTENIVTWVYIGCYKWASSLYSGGTGAPPAL
jgi:hypothetical protein